MSQWEPSVTVRRRARAKLMTMWVPLWIRLLTLCNQVSPRRVVDPRSPVDVSLTTFGPRIELVHLTIESIGLGRSRPRRLILWVDDLEIVENPPAELQRLRERGLEILPTEDFGPHKKYFPYVRSAEGDQSLVTADDDILYPPSWLHTLVHTHQRFPDDVVCHRAHAKRYEADGTLAPYVTWHPCLTTSASTENFATGVAGVLYPPVVVRHLAKLGEAFTQVCPRTDDIWLHYATQDAGSSVRQCSDLPRVLRELPGSQVVNLASANVFDGENDAAVARTAAYFGASTTRL